MTKEEQSRAMASLAVLRNLNGSGKNIYDAIGEFLKDTIYGEKKLRFSLYEITMLLNNRYDFKLNTAVIKTVLKQIPQVISDGRESYHIDGSFESLHEPKIEEMTKDVEQQIDGIIEKLYKYAEEEGGLEINPSIKNELSDALYCHLLNRPTSKYENVVSAFCIKCQNDETVKKELDTIREGFILHSGVRYSANGTSVGRMNSKLVLYLDMEVLFDMASYNGTLYKTAFDDFYNYVQEINSKTPPGDARKIELRYFEDVYKEIDTYFNTVKEYLVSSKRPSKIRLAMESILEGCTTEADILEKRGLFDKMLEDHHIHVETNINYYSDKHKPYCLESLDKLDTKNHNERYSEKELAEALQYLNYINIRREGFSKKSLEDSKHLIVTRTNLILVLMRDKELKFKNECYLATDLFFITNRFWFNLQKGFGDGSFPSSLSVVSNSQIVLSSLLQKKTQEEYDRIVKAEEEGKISAEDLESRIVALRSSANKPEDINEDNVDAKLEAASASINENYRRYYDENFNLKMQNKTLNETIIAGNKEVEKKDEANRQLKEENDKLVAELVGKNKAEIATKEERLCEVNDEISEKEEKLETMVSRLHFANYTFAFIYIAGVILICWLKDSNTLNFVMTVVTGFFYVLGYTGLLKKFVPKNINDLIDENFKPWYSSHIGINALEEEKATIEDEICKLKCKNEDLLR